MVKQTALKLNSSNDVSQMVNEHTDLIAGSEEQQIEYVEDLEHDGILMTESMVFVSKKADLFKILTVSFLLFTAIGIGASSKVVLTLNRICVDLCSLEDGTCDAEESQRINSQVTSICMFLLALICLVVAGKIGEFSDKYGRKITLIISLTFLFTGKALCTYIIINGTYSFNVVLYVLAFCVDALFGGMKSFMSTIRAAAADISSEKDRVAALSSVMGSLFVGVAFGPTIYTILKKIFPNIGNVIPLYIELFIMFSLILVVMLFVREVHQTNSRLNLSMSITSLNNIESKSIFQHLLETTKALRLFRIKTVIPLFPESENDEALKAHNELAHTKNTKIIILVINDCIIQGTLMSLTMVSMLYFTHVLEWNSADLSFFLMVTGITKAIQAFILIPSYNHFTTRYTSSEGLPSEIKSDKLGSLDLFNLRAALFFMLLEICILSVAKDKAQVTFSILVGSFGLLGIPVSHHVLVKLCRSNIFSNEIIDGNDEQHLDDNDLTSDSTKVGEFFGAVSLLENVSLMVINPTILWIYGATVKSLPQAPFIFAGSLILICNLLLWSIKSDL